MWLDLETNKTLKLIIFAIKRSLYMQSRAIVIWSTADKLIQT